MTAPTELSASKPTWGFRLAPRTWPKLFAEVRENPGDVGLGARVFFSIGGHDEEPTYRRMCESPTGRDLVAKRADYPGLFYDYDALRALPAGTLGREYVRDLDERGIHPSEIDRETETAYVGVDFTPEHAYVRDRIRRAHDLYHTLTGYGIDIIGESGVLTFTFAQTGNKGWMVLVMLNWLTGLAAGRLDGIAVSWRAYLRGRRARYLAAVADWERLLALSLEEVRAELGITPMRPYRPLQLEEAFGAAANRAG